MYTKYEVDDYRYGDCYDRKMDISYAVRFNFTGMLAKQNICRYWVECKIQEEL